MRSCYRGNFSSSTVSRDFPANFLNNAITDKLEADIVVLSNNSFVKNAKVKTNIQLRHNAGADYINCNNITVLQGSAYAKFITSPRVSLYDNANVKNIICDELKCNYGKDSAVKIDEVETKTADLNGYSLINNMKTDTTEIKDCAQVVNLKVKNKLDIKNNSYIKNLELLNNNTIINVSDNARVDNIKGKKIALILTKHLIT